MPADSSIQAHVFWQPRAGHRAEEYEDAAAVSRPRRLPLAAAVADGATETAYARPWAQHLVRGFADDPAVEPDALERALPAWREAWRREVDGGEVGSSWYAEAKRREGAHAAFLGLRLDERGTWRALAVGDCCLFHLREDTCRSWPFDEADAFGHRPPLLSSLSGADAVPHARTAAGEVRPGDAFILSTDALAAWLLADDPAVALAWTPAAFEAAVQAARADGRLRDDDVTALVLEIG